jgi:hypothetical protein
MSFTSSSEPAKQVGMLYSNSQGIIDWEDTISGSTITYTSGSANTWHTYEYDPETGVMKFKEVDYEPCTEIGTTTDWDFGRYIDWDKYKVKEDDEMTHTIYEYYVVDRRNAVVLTAGYIIHPDDSEISVETAVLMKEGFTDVTVLNDYQVIYSKVDRFKQIEEEG